MDNYYFHTKRQLFGIDSGDMIEYQDIKYRKILVDHDLLDKSDPDYETMCEIKYWSESCIIRVNSEEEKLAIILKYC
jgi:hypothetical protein